MINQTSLLSVSKNKIVLTDINNNQEKSTPMTDLIYSLDVLVNGHLACGLDQKIRIYDIKNWNTSPSVICQYADSNLLFIYLF